MMSVRCTRSRQRQRSWRHAMAGLSLVELMVSMAISLVILAALVGMFVNTSTNSREMERSNSVIENGRLAIQVLQNDVVHAGFWGSLVPPFDDLALTGPPASSDVPTAVPSACLPYSPTNWTSAVKTNLIDLPLDASSDATICSAIVTDKQPNTDVLVVRHAETCAPDVASGCPANTPGVAGNLYFQASRCGSDLTSYVLDTAGFVLRQRDCSTIAEKRAYVSDVYYVRTYAVTAGDGIPTLVRSQFGVTPATGTLEQQPPVPLIEGIEGFSVEFGVDDHSKPYTDASGVAHPDGNLIAASDYSQAVSWLDPDTRVTALNRGDGSPDGNFVRCAPTCSLEQLENVTAVKLYVLARSRDVSRGYTDSKTYSLGTGTTLGPFNDAYKRHLFVTTIRLPNVAGRRETPP